MNPLETKIIELSASVATLQQEFTKSQLKDSAKEMDRLKEELKIVDEMLVVYRRALEKIIQGCNSLDAAHGGISTEWVLNIAKGALKYG